MNDRPDSSAAAKGAQQTESAAPAPPCAMVIFGAAGDLTKRLVVPALYNLVQAGQLSQHFQLVGFDHNARSTQQWRKELTGAMEDFVGQGGEFHVDAIDQSAWSWLTGRMSYVKGDINDAGAETEPQWGHVIIEKPFGHDLASAKALNAEILKTLQEHQIYRIDHFLGKETVQNIMALRFANGLFEPIWNREHIDHIQITASETVGVERRGKFYEKTGAPRDMVPNHLFQLL